jgi:hypothetical protein
LVRSVGVITREEVVEPGLLLEHIRGGRLRCFAFQREVHALVPPVLLWVAGLDPFDLDPQSQPPDGQFAQPIDGVRGRKRDAVIGPNDLRESKFLEGAFEHGERKFLLRGEQRLARE